MSHSLQIGPRDRGNRGGHRGQLRHVEASADVVSVAVPTGKSPPIPPRMIDTGPYEEMGLPACYTLIQGQIAAEAYGKILAGVHDLVCGQKASLNYTDLDYAARLARYALSHAEPFGEGADSVARSILASLEGAKMETAH